MSEPEIECEIEQLVAAESETKPTHESESESEATVRLIVTQLHSICYLIASGLQFIIVAP